MCPERKAQYLKRWLRHWLALIFSFLPPKPGQGVRAFRRRRAASRLRRHSLALISLLFQLDTREGEVADDVSAGSARYCEDDCRRKHQVYALPPIGDREMGAIRITFRSTGAVEG